jgi:hypothetical protein
MNYNDILIHINTVDERQEWLDWLDVYVSGSGKRQNAEGTDNRWREIITALEQEGQPVIAAKGLSEALQGMEVVNLLVAVDPSLETIRKVSAWLKKEVGPATLISFRVKPSNIGGAEVDFRGTYYNGSVAKKLNVLFTEHSDQVAAWLMP